MAKWSYKFRKNTCSMKLGVAATMIGIGGAAAVFLPAGAAAGAVVLTAAAAGQAIGGVGGNILAACMDRWFPAHSLDPSEQINHDVQLVVGHAIERVMRELIAGRSPHADLYNHLLKRDVAAAWHATMMEFDEDTTLAIPDPQELMVLAAEARETGNGDKLPACLDVDTWTRWLAPRFDSRIGVIISMDVVETDLAPALVNRFYWHLVEALKEDFTSDGKAYAALEMATSHSILAIVRDQSKLLTAMGAKLDRIEAAIVGKASVIALKLDDAQYDHFNGWFIDLDAKLNRIHALAVNADERLERIENRHLAKIDQLETEDRRKAERITRLEAALNEVQSRAAGGDAEAEAAIAYARKTADVSLVMALLSRVQKTAAERERVHKAATGPRLVDRALELADYHFRRGEVPVGRSHLDEALEFAPRDPTILRRVGRFAATFFMLDIAADAYHKLLRIDAGPHWHAVTHGDLGDIELANGHRRAALDHFDHYLSFSRSALKHAGETPEALRDVSVSLNKVGDVELAERGAAAALPRYEESLAICRRIAASFGETPQALRDISASLDRVGDVELAERGAAAALPLYDESLAIRRRIVASFETPEALRDMALSLERLGQCKAMQGDKAAGTGDVKTAIAMHEDIARRWGETWLNRQDIANDKKLIERIEAM